MSENEVEWGGRKFVAKTSKDHGCRDYDGSACALMMLEVDCQEIAKCTKYDRKDGRFVIFVEVRDERAKR